MKHTDPPSQPAVHRRALKDLITVAHERWLHGTGSWGAATVSAEVVRLADLGLFDQVRRVARLSWLPPPLLVELAVHLRATLNWPEEQLAEEVTLHEQLGTLDLIRADLEADPNWQEFHEVCELADRVDNFLAVLEQGDASGHLARDCRQNLELLLILSDWYEEQGRPAVAAEARHLLGLVGAALQGYSSGASYKAAETDLTDLE
jgi:hypothetical protein